MVEDNLLKDNFEMYEQCKQCHLIKEKANLVRELAHERETALLQSDFISMASHEFRTPIAIISSAIQLIERKHVKVPPEPIDKHIIKVKDAITRMTELIESSLNIAKLESGKLSFNPESFGITEMLRRMIENYVEVSPKTIFNVDLEQVPKRFNGDRYLLSILFSNIISNAVKYSLSGNNHPEVTIRSQLEDTQFSIVISDNGIGIPIEDLDRIGSKFFRAKNSMGTAGTGIGIYLATSFAELHNGSLSIDSILNQGTTIYITLPIES